MIHMTKKHATNKCTNKAGKGPDNLICQDFLHVVGAYIRFEETPWCWGMVVAGGYGVRPPPLIFHLRKMIGNMMRDHGT